MAVFMARRLDMGEVIDIIYQGTSLGRPCSFRRSSFAHMGHVLA